MGSLVEIGLNGLTAKASEVFLKEIKEQVSTLPGGQLVLPWKVSNYSERIHRDMRTTSLVLDIPFDDWSSKKKIIIEFQEKIG